MSWTEFKNKGLWKRKKLIVWSAGNNLLPPAFTFLLSFLVVQVASLDLWGEYVKVILFLTFLSQLVSWGNKEYLPIAFSKTPARLYPLWKESIVVRSVLLIPCVLAILFSSYETAIQYLLALILLFRFIYQSFEALILYERKYTWKIVPELLSGILFAGAVLLFGSALTFSELIWITLVTDLLKMVVVLILARSSSDGPAVTFHWSYLKQSFLFFMLTFTGLFISRIDQVITTVLLPLREVGEYQVMMSFLLVIQSSCLFIVQPFLKNIYRLKQQTIHKISWHVGWIGCLLNSIWIFIFYEILSRIYGIQLTTGMIAASYLFTIPIFYYTVYIFYLLKNNRVIAVIAMNVVGGLSILLFSFSGMFFFGQSMMVVLWSAVVSQFLLIPCYYFLNRSKSKVSLK
ncbi:MAG: hypothetical protein JWM14_2121 [Chitinophagaceae bacterium]|nr:hypothetical protein [Chitinophagaceae bacterium]